MIRARIAPSECLEHSLRMRDEQLYIAIGLAVLAVITGLVVSLVQSPVFVPKSVAFAARLPACVAISVKSARISSC